MPVGTRWTTLTRTVNKLRRVWESWTSNSTHSTVYRVPKVIQFKRRILRGVTAERQVKGRTDRRKIPAIMRTVSEAMKHRAISWLAELFGGRQNSADNENRQKTGKNPKNRQQPRLPTCAVMTFGTPFHTEKSQFVGDNPVRYVLSTSLPLFLIISVVRNRFRQIHIRISWDSKVLRDWYSMFWLCNETSDWSIYKNLFSPFWDKNAGFLFI